MFGKKKINVIGTQEHVDLLKTSNELLLKIVMGNEAMRNAVTANYKDITSLSKSITVIVQTMKTIEERLTNLERQVGVSSTTLLKTDLN